MSKNNNQQQRGQTSATIPSDEAPFIAPVDSKPLVEAAAEAGTLNTEQQPLAGEVQKSLNEVIPDHLQAIHDAVSETKSEETSKESLQPATASATENPISGVTAANIKVEEEPAKVDPKQVRIDNFVRPFRKYAELMGAGVPNNQASIVRNQRELFRSFRNLLAVDDASVFGPAFKEVLVVWHDNKDGAFDANLRLYRQIDNLQLSERESLEFNTLLRLMEAIHDPAKRQAQLLEIDLNRALPEIGGIDARGYLASFVRRF